MIDNKKYIDTSDMMMELYNRQGGSLFYNVLDNARLDTDRLNWTTAAKVPKDYKEFSISIYNTVYDAEIVKLVLFVNPRDLAYGQQQIFNNAYTRRGWVNTAWGNQQMTLSASGVSAGFYFYQNGKGGITNAYRRRSPGFINIMDIVGLFKNNGWYFLNGVTNPSLFRDGTSRVINVMDTIKIEYDGSTFLGSFGTLSLNDVAASPYKMEYSFEFIVSSLGSQLDQKNTDKRIGTGIDGHVARDGNQNDREVHVALQGNDYQYNEIIGLDTNELNEYFPYVAAADPANYDFTSLEDIEEGKYYTGYKEVTIPDGTFRITRGWRDGETHEGKCDFRTHTGTVYAALEGTVHKIQKSNIPGGCNYIVTTSVWQGKTVYVRYFHLETNSIILSKGDQVEIGDMIGVEGTDHGKYPKHCDFEIREFLEINPNYFAGRRIEATPILDAMWNKLHPLSDAYNYPDFRHLYAKHPGVYLFGTGGKTSA